MPEDPLVEHIFGRKAYYYRFELIDRLPDMLYKEKNFDVKVRLVNKENQEVMNSNIMRLCFAVCDADGNWVTENKIG